MTDNTEQENTEQENKVFEDADWVNLARIAHEESETFLEATQKERWRRNYALSQSEHPEGSKYLTEEFKHRSQAFRGKTEAAIRKAEAAFVVALFSNKSVVSITAENQGDKQADDAAIAVHKLVNYRLSKKDTFWFKTSLGAYHEAQINGNVVSEQYWEYRKVNNAILDDHPVIKLYPLEDIHISPSAGWLDPINTSPYLIVDIPMFVGDIKARMLEDWKTYSDGEIKAAMTRTEDKTVQRARVGEKQAVGDDQPSSVTEFDIAYIHKVFIRQDDEDWFYFTLGNSHLLSDPVLVQKIYPHMERNKRPFVWGGITIEPHKVHNRAMVDRVVTAQSQINDISNQRFDNVKQVLNKRKYVLRDRGVDYAALVKNITGQVILMDEKGAVEEEEVTDITSSAYKEQSVLDVDFDELAGTFSNTSVASSNRSLNDTVGGMQLLKGESSALTEYQLMIFVMTWVEAVVEQIAAMVQYYEDDEVIQLVAGEENTHDTIQSKIEVNADVGLGATDPQSRVTNLVMGIRTILEMFPQLQGNLDGKKFIEEVMGAIGYSDGSKFFKEEEGPDPEVEQLQIALQELQSVIATDQAKIQNKLNADMMLEESKAKSSMDELLIKLRSERQIKMTTLALGSGQKVREIEQKTGSDGNKFAIDLAKEANKRLAINNDTRELNYKIQTGKPGI